MLLDDSELVDKYIEIKGELYMLCGHTDYMLIYRNIRTKELYFRSIDDEEQEDERGNSTNI